MLVGIELGDEAMMLSGLLIGGAIPKPGRVGSLENLAHVESGAPQRPGLPENAEVGKAESCRGMGPERALAETLKSWRAERERGGMGPEKLLSSRRRVRREGGKGMESGRWPERRLRDRSRRRRRGRSGRSCEGKGPEKELRERKRRRRGEVTVRLEGMRKGPEKELLLRERRRSFGREERRGRRGEEEEESRRSWRRRWETRPWRQVT